MDRLLDLPSIQVLARQTSRGFVQSQVDAVLDGLRQRLQSGDADVVAAAQAQLDNLESILLQEIHKSLRPRLRSVVNATGVILHTNLGRAPLAKSVAQDLYRAVQGYTNLEYDLAAGSRGERDLHFAPLLCEILGCESATAVNNNAAAIFIVLNELAAGGEVVISRGELMEIGGSFRIPDILSKSGAILREVGTTNRTRLSDYREALGDNTRLFLKVHPSNYRILGFTESVSVRELAPLARDHGIPVVEDLGSGLLEELSAHGILGEPLAEESFRDGVDLVTMSGDKLLGGPQAGIIAGRKDLVERVKRNPLMRVVRLDKMAIATLEATLRLYRNGSAKKEIPVLSMISQDLQRIRRRAMALRRRLTQSGGSDWRFQVHQTISVIGGGSCPEARLPSWGVAVRHRLLEGSDVEAAMRASDPPIVARLEEDNIVVDVRTLLPGDEDHLVRFFHPDASA